MSTPRSAVSEAAAIDRRAFAEEVQYYLSQSPRQLPSRYLYDDLGSALFDAICRLPWYRVTRTEQNLLAAHARQILASAAPLGHVIELGPGNGDKLATLLGENDAAREVLVHLVDVSASALDVAARRIAAIPRVRVVPHPCDYSAGLLEIAEQHRSGGRTLVACLGSNLGNFDPPDADAFLRNIRATIVAGDALLIGTDLIKPERDLLLAYDDPLGVTAAFNRNLLVRANRELDADFDVNAFAHRSTWNAAAARVEMHLVSRHAQTVRVAMAGLEIPLAADEPIWTESSYKYEPDHVSRMLAQAGFVVSAQWVQDGFALTLAHASPVAPMGGTHTTTERVTVVAEAEPVSLEEGCSHLRQISAVTPPSRHVCEDCVRIGGRWVHLRTCQTCGATRCCDSSPNRHASKHARVSGHPVIASAEPGERWLYCYVDDDTVEY